MAKLSPDELWALIVETGLVSRPAAAALRAEHDASPSARRAEAKDVAAWLCERGTLTRWQARRMAAGDTGPFFYGDYRLLERHDRDGDAFEFTARHEPTGRLVTIVLMARKQWRDPVIRDSILRRMTVATQAQDPLLVRTWALEENDGRPFAVCEEVRGDSLADELSRRGALPLREAGEIALAAACAVAELHAAGEVHGGLSLDALVREPAAAGGRLRLRQFPLATDPHRVPPRALVLGEEELLFLGRRSAFVAPELVTGAACDARSDVYALGCLLHALVSGTLPNWRGDPRATLDRAVETGPEPLDPAVAPGPLARLVDYMTSREPQDRYPDAAEAARAIATCFGFPPPAVVSVPRAAEAPAVTLHTVPQVGVVTTAARPAVDPQAVRADTAEAAGRRGRLLRFAAGALAGVVLATAAAIVVVRTTQPSRRPARDRDGDRVASRPPEPRAAEPAVATPPVTPLPPEEESPQPAPAAAAESPGFVIVDDPALPWAPPGVPTALTLTHLPAGSQLLLAARPAEVLADDEGRLLVKALGPGVESLLATVASACGCPPEKIETLQAGWQPAGTDGFVVGWAARLVGGTSLPDDEAFRTKAWGAAAPHATTGEVIHRGPTLAYWAPSSARGSVLVAAPADALEEMVAAAGAGTPQLMLTPDLERLVGKLDGSRHLTILGSPYALLNGGRSMLSGPLEPLAAAVDALVGESVQAAALSVHCGRDFYVELDAVATLDRSAAVFARQIAERIAGYPAAAKAYCAARDLHPYGRAVVMELPTMVRTLAANVRSGAEGKVAVVNAYLPRHAGHNIALAAELALAQAAAATPVSFEPSVPAAPRDAVGRLGTTMTLSFAKDTLEKSIQMISDEIGVPMEIVGPDLQLEGITKNQSFALDEHDKPAGEILRAILAKANPDGKLVYVVRKKDGVESIEITTRAAAAKRGDVLPAAYQDVGDPPKKDTK
jgi:hypothetical protein